MFFDVGNVLLDEDALTFHVFRRHVEAIRRVRPDRTFGDLLAEREDRARSGSRWPVWEVVTKYLAEEEAAAVWSAVDREVRADFLRFQPPIPGAVEVVRDLAAVYRLGIIANQPSCGREAVLGILDCFEVIALSDEEGVAKPDPALFRIALDRAGVLPEEAVMIGDRPDNDIAPASSLGMRTILVAPPRRNRAFVGPTDPERRAYLASLGLLDAMARGPGPIRPTVAVESLDRVAPALAALEEFGSRADEL